ncbi:hypothetical protein BDR05DRAFT_1019556 [Suillus weaverae]|nr:hypothetical protein BDR05DRAFT_1019556 [Suillus weaverae]
MCLSPNGDYMKFALVLFPTPEKLVPKDMLKSVKLVQDEGQDLEITGHNTSDTELSEIGETTKIPYCEYHNFFCQCLLTGGSWACQVLLFFNDALFSTSSSVPPSAHDDEPGHMYEEEFECAMEQELEGLDVVHLPSPNPQIISVPHNSLLSDSEDNACPPAPLNHPPVALNGNAVVAPTIVPPPVSAPAVLPHYTEGLGLQRISLSQPKGNGVPHSLSGWWEDLRLYPTTSTYTVMLLAWRCSKSDTPVHLSNLPNPTTLLSNTIERPLAVFLPYHHMLEWEVNGPLLEAPEGPKMIRTRVQSIRYLESRTSHNTKSHLSNYTPLLITGPIMAGTYDSRSTYIYAHTKFGHFVCHTQKLCETDNLANIMQNGMMGQLQEEKMQVYIQLGIWLLYKGARG